MIKKLNFWPLPHHQNVGTPKSSDCGYIVCLCRLLSYSQRLCKKQAELNFFQQYAFNYTSYDVSMRQTRNLTLKSGRTHAPTPRTNPYASLFYFFIFHRVSARIIGDAPSGIELAAQDFD